MECFDCGEEIADDTATKIDVGGVVEMVVCSDCHEDPDYTEYAPQPLDFDGDFDVEPDGADVDRERAKEVFAAHVAGEMGFVDVEVEGETVLQYHDGVFNVVDVGGEVEERVGDLVERLDEVEQVPHGGRVEVARRGSVMDDVDLCVELLHETVDAELSDVELRTE